MVGAQLVSRMLSEAVGQFGLMMRHVSTPPCISAGSAFFPSDRLLRDAPQLRRPRARQFIAEPTLSHQRVGLAAISTSSLSDRNGRD